MDEKENLEKKIKNKIKKEIIKGKSFKETLEKQFLEVYPRERKREYLILSKEISKFKKLLETKAGYISITKKADELASKKQDRTLTDIEKITQRNVYLAWEKEDFIMTTFLQIKSNQTFSDNLKKYLFFNFYRTLCELTVKIFSDPLSYISQFLSQNWIMKKLTEDKLDLKDIRTILGEFKNKTDLTLMIRDEFDKYLGFTNQDSFKDRNDVTHEKRFFHEVSLDHLYKIINEVHMFNTAILLNIYFEDIGMGSGDVLMKHLE